MALKRVLQMKSFEQAFQDFIKVSENTETKTVDTGTHARKREKKVCEKREKNPYENLYIARASDTVDTSNPEPTSCENCPAGGHWDSYTLGPGLYCFHEAYFLGKSAPPQLAKRRQDNCPLNEEQP